MHVNEHKPAVSRLVGHKIDKRLDSACLKIGFSVWVCMVADGMTDTPNSMAEPAKIKYIRPQIVDIVEKIVPASGEHSIILKSKPRISSQEHQHAPDSHQCMHHQSSSKCMQKAASEYCCKPKKCPKCQSREADDQKLRGRSMARNQRLQPRPQSTVEVTGSPGIATCAHSIVLIRTVLYAIHLEERYCCAHLDIILGENGRRFFYIEVVHFKQIGDIKPLCQFDPVLSS